jgi:hypothetical protein
MKLVRKRLTYANVMSSIAVFLVIAGGSALAASGLAKNSVGTKQLKKNAVTTAKIKSNAVTAGKIKNGAVGGSKLGGGAVGAANLAPNSVGSSALADNAVGGSKIADGAVAEGKLANGAVTEGKIANDAVSGSKVKDGSLTGSDIQQGTLNQVKAANVYATEFDVSTKELVNPSSTGIKSGGCFLACIVEFPVNVETCSVSGSGVDATGTGTAPAIVEIYHSGDPKEIIVVTYDDEGNLLVTHDFSLVTVCPTSS